MSESQITLAVSIIPVLFTAFNAWLTQRMRADLADFKNSVEKSIREEYVPREVFETEVRRLDERLQARSR